MMLRCPKCGEQEACMSLYLDSLAPGSCYDFQCRECDEEFTREDVQEMLDSVEAWKAALAWIDAAPSLGK